MSAPPKVVDKGAVPAKVEKPTKRFRYLQFNSPIAGHTYAYAPGDVVAYEVPLEVDDEPSDDPKSFEVSDEEVQRLIDRGIAEEVTDKFAEENAAKAGRVGPRKHRVPKQKKIENAMKKEAPENAMGRKPVAVKTDEKDWPD